MLDWDKLRVFYTVAKTCNFTKAAEALDKVAEALGA